MPKRSAGLLMYRIFGGNLEVLLVHPGGPFWLSKDMGAWSIPKGEIEEGEDPLEAAMREFHEETSFSATGPFITLGEAKQSGRKVVLAWGFEGDCDPAQLTSAKCQIEWPPRSRRMIVISEVDRASWFPVAVAQEKIVNGQRPLLERLEFSLRRMNLT